MRKSSVCIIGSWLSVTAGKSGNAAFLQPLAKDKGVLRLLVSRVNNICSTVICCLATKAPCTVLTHQWVLQMRRHNDALFKACLKLHPHGNHQTLLDKLITWFCFLKGCLFFFTAVHSLSSSVHTQNGSSVPTFSFTGSHYYKLNTDPKLKIGLIKNRKGSFLMVQEP